MAPIGAKLGQNAFQTIPDISFFDAENQKMPNFEWPFTPRIWLRSASNFRKMRFRRFPTFHFSTPKKFFWPKFLMNFSPRKKFVRKSTNCLFLRSYGFLDVIGRCASKSYPQSFDFQLSTTFRGGIKEIVSIFAPDFRPKMTSRLLVFWLQDAYVWVGLVASLTEAVKA